MLVELLTTDEPPETSESDTADERALQRTRLVVSGLDGALALAEANTSADMRPIVTAAQRLTKDESREIRKRAGVVLNDLRRRNKES